LVDRAVRSDGIHGGCGVSLSVYAGGDEVRVAAVPDRAGDVAVEEAARFRRSGDREAIFCVESGVANEEVSFTVIELRTGLGGDLDASAAWTREFGGVRIVVDADLLDGGRRDADALHLDAVDDEGHTSG